MAFTLPPDPSYDRLYWRLVDTSDNEIVTWQQLGADDVAALSFDVSASAYGLPTGLYRVDMRAEVDSGGAPADYVGSAAAPPQEAKYLGVPVAVTNVAADSGADKIVLKFTGVCEWLGRGGWQVARQGLLGSVGLLAAAGEVLPCRHQA